MTAWRPDGVAASNWIAKASSEGTLCLVLGAGVNADIGGMSWQQLLRSIADPRMKQSIESVSRYDPGFAVELLVSRNSTYARRLRDALYPEVLPPRWAVSSDPKQRARFKQGTLNPLSRLAVLTAKAQPRAGFHVISYNYDTLLEETISALGHRAIATAPAIPVGLPLPLERRARLRSSAAVVDYTFAPEPAADRHFVRPKGQREATVRIIHPHGLLPRNGRNRQVILTGASYDWTSRAQFEPHNLFQLAAFAGLSCLFYGLSFADSTIRRLIRLGRDLRSTVVGDETHLALVLEDDRLVRERLRDRLSELGIASFMSKSGCQQRQVVARAVREFAH